MKTELSSEPIDANSALNIVKEITESWLVTAQRLVREHCKMKNYKELSGDFSEDKEIREQKLRSLDEWTKNVIQEKKNEIFFSIQQAAYIIIKNMSPQLKEKIKDFINIEKTLKSDVTIDEPKKLLLAVQAHCILLLKMAKLFFPTNEKEDEEPIVW